MSEGDLPEGWAESTMGDVADVVGGGTPKAADPANFAARGHPWVTPADLSGYRDVYIRRGSRDLSDEGLRASSAKLVPAGTVLMSSRAPIGYLAVASNPIATNQGFRSFICKPGIHPEFVYYWLMYSRGLIEEMGAGSTFTEISGSRCKEIPFRFPPISEQKRIAAKVRGLFAVANATRDRLARVPTILKRFRLAVLTVACDGRLTASDTATWTETTLGEASREITVGHVGPMADEYVDRGIPFLRSQNVREFRFDPKGLKFISKEFHLRLRKTILRPGDIAVVRSGNSGVACVVPPELKEANCADLVVIRPSERLDSAFAAIFLNSSASRAHVEDVKVGIAQGHFNIGSAREMPIRLPTLAEQRDIGVRVDALFKLADAIEKRVAAATAHAERLTQAILAKAFRGELVPDEAELPRRASR